MRFLIMLILASMSVLGDRYYGGLPASQQGFSKLAIIFQQYGVLDFLLPFLLVFAVTFAILKQMHIFESRKVSAIISMCIGLLFVVPHVLGTYQSYLGYDPVVVLIRSIPSVSMVLIACLMLIVLAGLFDVEYQDTAQGIIGLVAMIFILYIFGAALDFWGGPGASFDWWTPETTQITIILLVFGLIVWFITHEEKSQPEDKFWKRFGKGMFQPHGTRGDRRRGSS